LAVKRSGPAVDIPAGYERVTVASQSHGGDTLDVFVSPNTTLRIAGDAAADVHVYLWGHAGHPDLARSEVPLWIATQVALGNVNALRQLAGSFIALIDNRKTGAVSIVTDVAGTRAFFAGHDGDALVCGSDVWTMAQLGWISRRLNYDAIAAWVRAGYDFTEGSLFSDVSLVGAGAVTTIQNCEASVKTFAVFDGGRDKPPREELLDRIHAAVTRSFLTATRELGPFQIALSGGFDSRYVAALAVEHGLDLRATCLSDRPSEAPTAAKVAERLGIPLQIVATNGSRWNAFDEPFHFAPSGFPISKQQSYAAAIQNPGRPCLNGFMGDGMIRNPVDRLEGKLPWETSEEPARLYLRGQLAKPAFARFDLVEPDILHRCDERTLPICRRHIAKYAHTANVFASVMYLCRHRTYFGNNFTQHLSVAEPILPFANYDLIQNKCRTHPDCFSWETYEALFARFYPRLADIPHNEKSGGKQQPDYQPSAATPIWLRRVLTAMIVGNRLKILNRTRAIPRLLRALREGKNADITALFTYRLLLLEQRLLDAGVELDWDAI
jgi:hypothetical protein